MEAVNLAVQSTHTEMSGSSIWIRTTIYGSAKTEFARHNWALPQI